MTRESRHLVLATNRVNGLEPSRPTLFPNRPPRRRPAFHLRPRPSAR